MKKCVIGPLALALVLTPLVLSGCGTPAASGGRDQYQQAITVARGAIWADINAGLASAGAAAILDGGNVVYSEGFGPADRSVSSPVTPSTLFNIGSCSKAFVGAALMTLVDRGKVKLDAPVTRYLPEFKMEDPRYKDITVRMLLNHTSGFPGADYANNMGYAFNDKIYEDTMANLARSHLKAAPGETAPYCNDGFTLAEMIVAKVSGKKFIDYVMSDVCAPLGLVRTGPSVGERPDDGIARYYQPDNGKMVPPEVLSVAGAGGISSTVEEMVEFMDSFAKGGRRILSDASIAAMTSPSPSAWAKACVAQAGVNPEMTYGLGFDQTYVPKYKAQGIRIVAKGGDSDVYHSMMLLVPDKRIAVAVIAAGAGPKASDTCYAILDSVLEAKGLYKPAKTSVVPPSPQPLPSSYADLGGIYAGDTHAYRLSMDYESNTVDLGLMDRMDVVKTIPLTYRDGELYSETGDKFRLLDAGGRVTLLVSLDGGYMTMGQLLAPIASPVSMEPGFDGKMWVRRNVKPWEAMSTDVDMIKVSSAVPELPGYIDLRGIKKVSSPTFAGMSVDAIRDLTELTLFDQGGRSWARVSDYLYSAADTTVSTLSSGAKTVTIGKDGYNEWLKTGSDLVFTVKKPASARVVIFAPDGSPSYDSEVDQGQVFAPAGSFLMLAGNPGQSLAVTAAPAGK